MKCPVCKKDVDPTNPEFPFCSDRCRTIDLGKWASGGYVISTPITDPEMLENLADEQSKNNPNEEDTPRKH